MEALEVTKLSSKGQVVLPQAIREKLDLREGEKFVVMGHHDTIILKKLEMPSPERVRALLRVTRAYAKRAGLSPRDVEKTIRKVRSQPSR